jgi:CspA family cold shock protein
MATGIVKWFNDAKGFGFIEPDGGGGDIFAHFSSITMDGFKTLKQGARVSFDVVDGPKGKLAHNIRSEQIPDDLSGLLRGTPHPQTGRPSAPSNPEHDSGHARSGGRRSTHDLNEGAASRGNGSRGKGAPRVRAPQFQANHPRGA